MQPTKTYKTKPNQDFDTRPVAKLNTFTRNCTTRPDDDLTKVAYSSNQYYTFATRRNHTYVSVSEIRLYTYIRYK